MAAQQVLTTAAEFEAFLKRPENRERIFELIEGEIIESMVTEEHGALALAISGELHTYLKSNRIGRAGVEVRFRMPDDEANSIQPDVSFLADLSRPAVKQGPVLRMPDLAVEIKSPDDTIKKIRDKADYYLKHGTKLVWLIFPDQRIVEVYAPESDSKMLSERDTLDGADVLPGFSLAVAELFKGL